MIRRPSLNSSRAVAIALICCTGLGTAALAQTANQTASETPTLDQQSSAAMKDTAQDPRIAKSQSSDAGIWKWVVPPVKMKGAFDDNDPIGVITGRKIPADCSINWTDPDTHRLFCFSSATSLVYFLNTPKGYTARADKAWQGIKGAPTG